MSSFDSLISTGLRPEWTPSLILTQRPIHHPLFVAPHTIIWIIKLQRYNAIVRKHTVLFTIPRPPFVLARSLSLASESPSFQPKETNGSMQNPQSRHIMSQGTQARYHQPSQLDFRGYYSRRQVNQQSLEAQTTDVSCFSTLYGQSTFKTVLWQPGQRKTRRRQRQSVRCDDE